MRGTRRIFLKRTERLTKNDGRIIEEADDLTGKKIANGDDVE